MADPIVLNDLKVLLEVNVGLTSGVGNFSITVSHDEGEILPFSCSDAALKETSAGRSIPYDGARAMNHKESCTGHFIPPGA